VLTKWTSEQGHLYRPLLALVINTLVVSGIIKKWKN